MNIILKKWDKDLKDELIEICNKVDRSFLSDRLPYPYTKESADWYLGMVAEHTEKMVSSVQLLLMVKWLGIFQLSRSQMYIVKMEI